MIACVSVDVEHDCPPHLSTWRGLDAGMPRLLDLFAEEAIPATYFTTGSSARRWPDRIAALVKAGHELGCHGDTHTPFPEMTRAEADGELRRSTETLRSFDPVTSFRAPFLRLPDAYLDLLVAHGFTLDSSQGRHKHLSARVYRVGPLWRIPASITSSTTRWPSFPRDRLLKRLRSPAVLFVHPWEFVDLRREPLRLDYRWRTGDMALTTLRSAIRVLKGRGATFVRMREVPGLSPSVAP